jgi:hypothetical protein
VPAAYLIFFHYCFASKALTNVMLAMHLTDFKTTNTSTTDRLIPVKA